MGDGHATERPEAPPSISVIVPALNEAAQIADTLWSVTLGPDDALIVVDGGSTDETMAIARRYTSQVVSSPSGRSRQMNCGAELARGDVLLFLHADTRLPAKGLEAVRDAVQLPQVVGGSFRLAFHPATTPLQIVAWGTNMRTRWGKMPYGDQALFVRRALFEKIGGYEDVPFLEDVKLVQTLRRHGEMVCLKSAVQTSGRRWLQRGLMRTTLCNNMIMMLYFCGVSPATLKRWYT